MAMADYLSLINNPTQGLDAAVKEQGGTSKHITLKFDTTWKILDHTDETPAWASLTDQDEYEPAFKVRGIKLDHATTINDQLEYDKKYNTVSFVNIVERFNCNQIYPIQPVKIHLNSSSTTADCEIHLHG